MAPASPAIDIATPARFSSSSPRNQASNLTSALQQAGSSAISQPVDTKQRNGQEQTKPNFGRQDSVGFGFGASQTGARPILSGKNRRESTTGSFVGGMSWGGISVGSWLQDDIMMGGTSPYNVQSPSYHSSSYLPKMEANFWNNLRCCDTGFGDLHELLQHFEEVHSQQPQTFPFKQSQSIGRRKASLAPGAATGLPTMVDASKPLNQVRGFQSAVDAKSSALSAFRSPQLGPEMQNKSSLSNVQDMDTLGDMEMDDDAQMQGMDQATPFTQPLDNFQQNNNNNQILNTSFSTFNDTSGFATPTPNTPVVGNQALPRQSNNPMVSSVNTPSLGTQSLYHTSNRATPDVEQVGTPDEADINFDEQFSMNNMQFNPQLLQGLNTDFSNMDFGVVGGNEMIDLCINDPAKALFSEQGGLNTQQFPQFSFMNGANMANNEASRRLQAQQFGAGFAGKARMAGEEERPFKCPVIGCEKAYKNANGLRYHEKHGHSTQKLKENGDGTFSIVDPVTSQPYPGTVGMEKEKPYRCEVCGKRYKNLNGLKYHRNHSPPCNPDFNFNNIALPGMAGAGETIY